MTAQLIDLIVEDVAWLDQLPDLHAAAEQGATLALSAARVVPDHWQIAVLACSDERIAALNSDHRGKPTSTNVLSWPAHVFGQRAPGSRPAAPPKQPGPGRFPLGNVAIALKTCTIEAESGGIPLKTHATHLILHSVLHLLGYDHQNDEDAELMEGIESSAMISAGFPDPYGIERQDRTQ